MRARNIKPATFQNELLGTSDPLHTVVFAGLWCLADREGRLEDRPGKIHMQINAGRPYETTVRALDWLTAHAFIQRFEIENSAFIFILEFRKHQSPHVREPDSVIPKPPKYVKPKRLNGQAPPDPVLAPDKSGAEHRPFPLIPSSLIPDSPSLIPDSRSVPSREDLQLQLTTQGSPSSGAKRADDDPAKRGSRIPEPFIVSCEAQLWAEAKFPGADLGAITEEFVDYWKGVPGARGRKLDWQGTWRNRVREKAERVAAASRPKKTRYDQIMEMRNARREEK